MTMRGVRPVRLPRVAGDRERLQRTKRLLERDIHRLERSLAQRRSPEGQESTRAVILHKRAQAKCPRSLAQARGRADGIYF